MKIKIDNRSAYDGRDLRKILRAAFERVHCASKKFVEIREAESYGLSVAPGKRGAEGEAATLELPPDASAGRIANMALWAARRTVVPLRQFTPEQREQWKSEVLPDWCPVHVIRLTRRALQVPKPPRPPKPKPSLAQRRADHAAKKWAEAKRKLKVAQTVERRWRKRVRYYEAQTEKRIAPRVNELREAVEQGAAVFEGFQ